MNVIVKKKKMEHKKKTKIQKRKYKKYKMLYLFCLGLNGLAEHVLPEAHVREDWVSAYPGAQELTEVRRAPLLAHGTPSVSSSDPRSPTSFMHLYIKVLLREKSTRRV